MPDREKVIKGLECCTFILGKRKCNECPYQKDNGCYQLQDDFHALLKEQEAVKPVRDKKTGRVWLCGNCGSYVGFEDHDENDPNEFDKYCRECGRAVKWE